MLGYHIKGFVFDEMTGWFQYAFNNSALFYFIDAVADLFSSKSHSFY